jgi:hypothetical protein
MVFPVCCQDVLRDEKCGRQLLFCCDREQHDIGYDDDRDDESAQVKVMTSMPQEVI